MPRRVASYCGAPLRNAFSALRRTQSDRGIALCRRALRRVDRAATLVTRVATLVTRCNVYSGCDVVAAAGSRGR